MSKPIVSIQNVSKFFGKFVAVENVSIDIEPGEFFCLLGPSGCGKTTLLRMIAGFETPSEGEILLDGADMTEIPPNKRPVNMVFQSYAVFPHMTVAANVAYGLKIDGVPRAEIDERVAEALALVQLSQFAHRKPDQLSGGQRQRVALARALVKKPRVLLLDEPLSALDAKLRDAMRLELVKLQQSIGVSFIMVTHDQDEAMAVADRVAVLDGGRMVQMATPATLYQKPIDAFVADFIGRVNMFTPTAVTRAEGGVTISTEELGDVLLPGPAPDGAAGELRIAIRPEKIRVSATEPASRGKTLRGKLGDVAFQGDHSIVEVRLDDGASMIAYADDAQGTALARLDDGAPVWCDWTPDDMLLLPRGSLG
ncbi:ABC transporter ATP-binding protein [Rhodobacteraceae bacterium NNCM2]|nr:ABC transporter ATP-binding protein [Coraliihabitans acroporae]